MKNLVNFLAILVVVFSTTVANAQPYALVDATPKSFGIGGGASFGNGKVQPGFLIDAYHSYDLNELRPDMEAYGSLSWSISDHWFAAGFLGGGVTIAGEEPQMSYSLRSFWFLTETTPVAFRTSNFAMWIPERDSWFIQQKFGPSIKLNDSNSRIFPYLALGLSTPGLTHRVDIKANPGATYLMSF